MKNKTILGVFMLSILVMSLVPAYVSASDSPIVTLVSPSFMEAIHDYPKRDSSGVGFFFTVTSPLPLSRCELYVDNVLNTNVYGASTSQLNVVAVDLNAGAHIAYIACQDQNGGYGVSNTNVFIVCKSKGQCKKL